MLASPVLAFSRAGEDIASNELQPRKQPGQARSEATRQRILQAAARVFADHGYPGTTNRIAEYADVSSGSRYQHFPNKDAVLVELKSANVHSGVAVTRQHLAGGLPESIADIVRLFVRPTVDNHREDPQLHRVLFEETPRPPNFLRLADESALGIVELTQVVLADHPDVRVTDTHTAAGL